MAYLSIQGKTFKTNVKFDLITNRIKILNYGTFLSVLSLAVKKLTYVVNCVHFIYFRSSSSQQWGKVSKGYIHQFPNREGGQRMVQKCLRQRWWSAEEIW